MDVRDDSSSPSIYAYNEGYGEGVYGYSNSTYGVYGRSSGSSGRGVYGYCPSGYGVYGYSSSGRALYGHSSDGYAGYFQGPKSYFSGLVGIGRTDPESFDTYADNLVVYESGSAGITIASGYNGSIYFADGTSGDTAYKGFIKYQHSSDRLQLGANSSEIMTLQNGKVGIGKTNPTAELDLVGGATITGNVGIGIPNTGSFKLVVLGTAAKPGGGSWSFYSDVRLKDLNGTYERGLSEINMLNPVRYNYKEDNELDLPADEEFVGFVAQEVQEIIPEAVETNDDGYLLLNNDPIIWTMVNAIKELKAENDELRARLEALEKTLQ